MLNEDLTVLTLEAEKGIPPGVRHAVRVMEKLGVADDSMFLAVLNDSLNLDPLHLCRMLKNGLAEMVDGLIQDRLEFLGTDLHLLFGNPKNPGWALSISILDNSISPMYFNKEVEKFVSIDSAPISPYWIVEQVQEEADKGAQDILQCLAGILNEIQIKAKEAFENQRGIK